MHSRIVRPAAPARPKTANFGDEYVAPETAIHWYGVMRRTMRELGMDIRGVDIRDFLSQIRCQGALNVATMLARRHPDRLLHDPDAVWMEDIRVRLAIADAWLRGELDRRPAPAEITQYSRVIEDDDDDYETVRFGT